MWKLLVLLYSAIVFSQTDVSIKVSDVAKKVNTSNLEIMDGATRVYNSKERIKFARASLLPKLNIWRLSTVLVDWKSAADVITQDLVPFLVPGNWQKSKQAKILSEATVEGFHGLSKNTIFHAKLQYFQIQQDAYQLDTQKLLLSDVEDSIKNTEGQIYINPLAKSWLRELTYQKTLIESDVLSLEQLLWEERQQLSLALGLSTDSIILTDQVLTSEVGSLDQIELSSEDTSFIDSSCELKEYDHLLRVLPSVKKEIAWNVFGVSEISRGAAGGIFDAIPIQDGLGFGTSASLKIHKSQMELLKKQREGVVQVLTRQKQSILKSMQRIKDSRAVIENRFTIAKQELAQAELEMSLGSPIAPVDLVDLKQKIVLIEIEKVSNHFQQKIEVEKLSRLNGLEDYNFEQL